MEQITQVTNTNSGAIAKTNTNGGAIVYMEQIEIPLYTYSDVKKYKSYRFIKEYGKAKWVIVNENGDVINKSPSKNELKGLEKELYNKYYNSKHSCDRCEKSFDEVKMAGRFPLQEYDKQGNWTGNWDCPNCQQKYDPNSQRNIMKSVANCRTGNQNPDHSCTKGDNIIDLACELYGYTNLNKKYDRYNTKIDCQDPKTGLLYQIRGESLLTLKKYASTREKLYNEGWPLPHLERELYKEYQEMIYFCKSKDGKTIEIIYRFPLNILKEKRCITIRKNYPFGWYEQYRIKDTDELKKANEIWKNIILKYIQATWQL